MKSTIPISGFAKAIAPISIGGFVISDLGTPIADADAATKKYADNILNKPDSLALPERHLFVGNDKGKAVAIDKQLIPISGFAEAKDNINMGNKDQQFGINFLKYPVDPLDAVTKSYVDDQFAMPSSLTLPGNHILVGNKFDKATPIAKRDIPLNDFGDATGEISMGNNALAKHKITNLETPTDEFDAVNKKYADAQKTIIFGEAYPANPKPGTLFYSTTGNHLYMFDGKLWSMVDDYLPKGYMYVGSDYDQAMPTIKTAIPISGFGVPLSDIRLGDGIKNFKIINLANPKTDQDAATKKYVDSVATSVTTKTPVGPTAPDKPVAGDTYYNTTDNSLYVFNGKDWVPVDNKLKDKELFVGNDKGIAVSTKKDQIPLSGFGSAEGDVSMGHFRIYNLLDPVEKQDAVTKNYLESALLTAGANAKDNLGNHKATESIKLSVYAISNDGIDGKGLTFDTQGNASFGQDVTVNGNFFTPSDSRLKTNIETLGSVLQKIDQLRGVKFEYKDQHKYAAGSKVGVIAQELQKVYPEMVTKGKDGFLKVDYTQLTGMLIQAVKEQQKQIDELQNRMNKQQEQINSILKKIQ
ncbi:tail fiber domain-containing protein [Pedobacter sp. NJ-S-72]